MTARSQAISVAIPTTKTNPAAGAASAFMRQSLERAISAGNLLIEAKAQLGKHGQWLPWLREHCSVPERTAQLYMRLAKHSPQIRNVADLSLREAAEMIADPLRELRRLKQAATRASYTLETPQALLPSPTGRKMGVARNPAKRQWMLAIGPNISRAKLQQQQQAAQEAEPVRQLQQQRDDLLDDAAALEAEAKKLREDARAVNGQISAEIKSVIESIGQPILPYTETYDFQSKDKKTDDKLAKLTHQQRVERLLAARDAMDGPLREIDRGFWGDLNLPSSQPFTASPGWTNVGSPEWLDELFPAWNDENESETA